MKKKRTTEPTEPRLESLRLADLIPHPDQGDYFPSYGKPEREALKGDIRVNKLKHPIVVLPPGNRAGLPPHTILVGHTRRKTLLELGETTTGAQRPSFNPTSGPSPSPGDRCEHAPRGARDCFDSGWAKTG